MTCPACEHPGRFETFTSGARLCPRCGIMFWLADDGELVMVAETSKSQPRSLLNRARLVGQKG